MRIISVLVLGFCVVSSQAWWGWSDSTNNNETTLELASESPTPTSSHGHHHHSSHRHHHKSSPSSHNHHSSSSTSHHNNHGSMTIPQKPESDTTVTKDRGSSQHHSKHGSHASVNNRKSHSSDKSSSHRHHMHHHRQASIDKPNVNVRAHEAAGKISEENNARIFIIDAAEEDFEESEEKPQKNISKLDEESEENSSEELDEKSGGKNSEMSNEKSVKNSSEESGESSSDESGESSSEESKEMSSEESKESNSEESKESNSEESKESNSEESKESSSEESKENISKKSLKKSAERSSDESLEEIPEEFESDSGEDSSEESDEDSNADTTFKHYHHGGSTPLHHLYELPHHHHHHHRHHKLHFPDENLYNDDYNGHHHHSTGLGPKFSYTKHSTGKKHSFCPMLYKRIGDRCIAIFSIAKVSWSDAADFCESIFGDLIHFADFQQYFEFMNHLQISDVKSALWIGGKTEGRTWKWIDGNSMPLGSPYWAIKSNPVPQWSREAEKYYQAPSPTAAYGLGVYSSRCASMSSKYFYYLSDENCESERSPVCVLRDDAEVIVLKKWATGSEIPIHTGDRHPVVSPGTPKPETSETGSGDTDDSPEQIDSDESAEGSGGWIWPEGSWSDGE